MRLILLFLILLIGNSKLYSQDSSLAIRLIVESDTITLADPFKLKIRIQNVSQKVLLIPDTITVISDLFPNGLENLHQGGIVKITIQQLDGFSGIYIEDITVITPSKFILLKPNEFKEFVYDFGQEIKAHKEFADSDNLAIQKDRKYEIQITYSNNYKDKVNPECTFTGTINSDFLTIYSK